jgi:hypothetical protein
VVEKADKLIAKIKKAAADKDPIAQRNNQKKRRDVSKLSWKN